MEATVKRICDYRRLKKKTNTYPLGIRVTYNRKPIVFLLNLDVSLADSKKLSSPRVGPELTKIKAAWIREEDRAREIVRNLGTFTFQAFREAFYGGDPSRLEKLSKKGKGNTLGPKKDSQGGKESIDAVEPANSEGKNKKYGKRRYDRIRSNVNYDSLGPLAVLYGEYIKTLEKQGRIGTSEAYFCSIVSLLKFKTFLRVEDITVDFLYGFENWFLGKGGSETTVGIYLRPLRCILNIQKSKGMLSERNYPFGLRKYLIPAAANIKIALDLSELKALWDYQYSTNDESELFYLAIWFFGFFANGINPKDIINLKFENFHGDFIVILRQKTRRSTRRAPKMITILVNEPMRKIVDRFGNPDKSTESYVFNVLKPGLSPHRQRELGQEFTCAIIDWMNKIAAKVNVTKRITTKVYRHSFATLLKRSGVSTEFIMEALGHHDLKTTENYLADFELEVKRKAATNLMVFIEQPEMQAFGGF